MLSACAGTTRLDRAALENEIEAQLLPGYPGQISSITCPEVDEPAPGQAFTCAAILGDQVLDVDVVLGGTDDALTSAASVDARFVASNEVAALLAATFGSEIGIPTSVDCGQPVIALPEGDTLICEATDPRGVVRSFDVAINAAGEITLSLR